MHLCFVYPSSEEFRKAEYFAFSQIPILRKQGVLSIKEIDNILLRRGTYTPEMHRRRQQLHKQLGLMRLNRKLILFEDEDFIIDWCLLEILSGIRLITYDPYQAILFAEEFDKPPIYQEYKMLTELLAKFHSNGIEYQTKEMKIRYLLSICLRKLDNRELIWKNYEHFSQSQDMFGIGSLKSKFVDFLSGFPAKLIRIIARSPQWTTRWISATQTGSPLFNHPITEWNANQLSLCYWSMFYENLSQNPEAPRGEQLKNDDLVDAWVESENSERERRRTGSSSGNPHQQHMGSPSAHHKVVFK